MNRPPARGTHRNRFATLALCVVATAGCGSAESAPEPPLPSVQGVWEGSAENYLDLPEPSRSDISLHLIDIGGAVVGTLYVKGTAHEWSVRFDPTDLQIVAHQRIGEAEFEWIGVLDPDAETLAGTYGPRLTESHWSMIRTEP